MRSWLSTVAIIGSLYFGWSQLNGTFDVLGSSTAGNEQISSAFRDQRSGVQVSGDGVVSRVLSDDNDGSPHQRFILRLASGQTSLIAHNIDLAQRVPSLDPGDTVAFSGVYEWNSKGGVVHWTHHDPRGQHQPGWLKHNGETFQ
jgi:hypothetical protein